jgi:hypothetical protein
MLNNKLPSSEIMHISYCCLFVFVDFSLKSQIYKNIQESIAMVFLNDLCIILYSLGLVKAH